VAGIKQHVAKLGYVAFTKRSLALGAFGRTAGPVFLLCTLSHRLAWTEAENRGGGGYYPTKAGSHPTDAGIPQIETKWNRGDLAESVAGWFWA
jgi:hypothetical protein